MLHSLPFPQILVAYWWFYLIKNSSFSFQFTEASLPSQNGDYFYLPIGACLQAWSNTRIHWPSLHFLVVLECHQILDHKPHCCVCPEADRNPIQFAISALVCFACFLRTGHLFLSAKGWNLSYERKVETIRKAWKVCFWQLLFPVFSRSIWVPVSVIRTSIVPM